MFNTIGLFKHHSTVTLVNSFYLYIIHLLTLRTLNLALVHVLIYDGRYLSL